MQRGRSAGQVEIVGLVDGQGFMDVAVRVNVGRHGAVERQTEDGGGGKGGDGNISMSITSGVNNEPTHQQFSSNVH